MKGIYLMIFSTGVLIISLITVFFTQNPIGYYFMGAASLLFVITLIEGIKAKNTIRVHMKNEK